MKLILAIMVIAVAVSVLAAYHETHVSDAPTDFVVASAHPAVDDPMRECARVALKLHSALHHCVAVLEDQEAMLFRLSTAETRCACPPLPEMNP